VKYRHSPEYDDMNPRWIICAYVGEGFLDFRLGPHRWRLHHDLSGQVPEPEAWINNCCKYGCDCGACYSRHPDQQDPHHCVGPVGKPQEGEQ
jgi:hypothetical protein